MELMLTILTYQREIRCFGRTGLKFVDISIVLIVKILVIITDWNGGENFQLENNCCS